MDRNVLALRLFGAFSPLLSPVCCRSPLTKLEADKKYLTKSPICKGTEGRSFNNGQKGLLVD